MRLHPRRQGALIGLCILGSVAGCDAPKITAPHPVATAGQIVRSDGSAALLGQATLGPSANALVPFAATAASTWVVVRIDGQFAAERNPACLAAEAAMPNEACPTATGIGSFSERLSYTGPVRVWRQSGASNQQLKVRAAGGGGIALMHSGKGGTLAARSYVTVPSWQLPGHNAIPAYFISGEYTVQAQEIPAPVQLTESAADDGGMRTYNLQTLYGLEFVNPTEPYYWDSRPTPNISWRFIPGENVSDKPGGAPFYTPVGKCKDKTECTYKPAGPGKMEVTTYVEGQQVAIRSSGVLVEPQRLEMTCNGAEDSVRITRADNLRCAVTGTTDVIGWEFVAESGEYRNPSEGATPFKGLVWEGKVVLSGTVTVSARIDGQEDASSVVVTVGSREWTGKTMQRQAAEEPTSDPHLPERPDSVRQLGHIENFLDREVSRDKWDPILSGPNANLAYLVDLPASYRGVIHVNRAALSVGSDFWNAQPTRQRSSGVVDCLRRAEDITGFIPVILRHEGVGFDPKSHAYLFVEEAERAGNSQFESVVATSLQGLEAQADTVIQSLNASANAAAARADSAGFAPAWCRFNYNYPRR